MQILCTQVLLFFHFRSHEIARCGMRTTPMAVVALSRWSKQRADVRRSPGRKILTDGHCRGGIPWHLVRSTSLLQAPHPAHLAALPERANPQSGVVGKPLRRHPGRPSQKPKGGTVSEPVEASSPRTRSSRNGGRHQIGTVSEIIPEWWATSSGISRDQR